MGVLPQTPEREQMSKQPQQKNFFESISNYEINPAILSIIAPYNAAFLPAAKKTMPKPLTEQLNEENLKTP